MFHNELSGDPNWVGAPLCSVCQFLWYKCPSQVRVLEGGLGRAGSNKDVPLLSSHSPVASPHCQLSPLSHPFGANLHQNYGLLPRALLGPEGGHKDRVRNVLAISSWDQRLAFIVTESRGFSRKHQGWSWEAAALGRVAWVSTRLVPSCLFLHLSKTPGRFKWRLEK